MKVAVLSQTDDIKWCASILNDKLSDNLHRIVITDKFIVSTDGDVLYIVKNIENLPAGNYIVYSNITPNSKKPIIIDEFSDLFYYIDEFTGKYVYDKEMADYIDWEKIMESNPPYTQSSAKIEFDLLASKFNRNFTKKYGSYVLMNTYNLFNRNSKYYPNYLQVINIFKFVEGKIRVNVSVNKEGTNTIFSYNNRTAIIKNIGLPFPTYQ